MVVVYSGESERPERWWDEGPPTDPGRPDFEEDTPLPPEPFLSSRELRQPPAPRFEAILPPPTPVPANSDESTRPEIPSALLHAESRAGEIDPSATLKIRVRSTGTLRLPRVVPAPVQKAPAVSANMRRAAVILAGAILGAYIALSKRTSGAHADPRVEIAKGGDVAPLATRAMAATPPPLGSQPAEETAPTSPAPSASVSVEGTFASASPALSPVELEVVPPDAKVIWHGVKQPGPPYRFNLAAGERISLEVARQGFVTRRVVLDGREPHVAVGLFTPQAARAAAARAAAAASTGGAPDPLGESPQGPRLRVRSGL